VVLAGVQQFIMTDFAGQPMLADDTDAGVRAFNAVLNLAPPVLAARDALPV
jgi:hypothetical protein